MTQDEWVIGIPKHPDYLSFVDPDVRALFKGKGGYLLSDILYAQLIKELRKLNKSHESEPSAD